MCKEISTTEAAEILNVSCPFVVDLLEKHRIPYRTVGKHRRIKGQDVLEYKKKDEKKHRAVIEALTRESQELGLEF